jgi:hypothetical protein
LAQQAVRVKVLGIGLKDVAAVRDGFIEPVSLLDQALYLAVVCSKGDL